MAEAPPETVRCAIYTRKSTEEGLEQAFNSLDAQREACAAYVQSQAHEGWMLVPGAYDDGGFSGGNLKRPGLSDLLRQVAAGQIDVILVYKIDRLTRSLADFAKIVEILDSAGASFVSITQAFNTTTSMGRLTLNVLLSFAQFEREVTGERIRDKIAASKAKGMWMGGPIPLGYDVRERQLVVDETDADTVRYLFGRYLKLKSVIALTDELAAQGITTKVRTGRRGNVTGGKLYSAGSLYHLLQNRLYIGDVTFKGSLYAGQHVPIVAPEMFDAVQSQLTSNRANRTIRTGARERSILAGRVFDGEGNRLLPSHSSDGPKRYRYYVTRGGKEQTPQLRVPAGALEPLVFKLIRRFLSDDHEVSGALAGLTLSAPKLSAALLNATELSGHGDRMLLPLLMKVTIFPDRVEVAMAVRQLLSASDGGGAATVLLTAPAELGRRGNEVRLIVEPKNDDRVDRRDPALVKLMVKAHQARQAVEADQQGMSITQIARQKDLEIGYFRTLLRLSYLAPDIVEAILDGNHPRQLTRQKLARFKSLPLEWSEQRKALGFA